MLAILQMRSRFVQLEPEPYRGVGREGFADGAILMMAKLIGQAFTVRRHLSVLAGFGSYIHNSQQEGDLLVGG